MASISELKCLGWSSCLAVLEPEAMRVRRLDHVLLAMPAGKESDARKFYRDILGIGGQETARTRCAGRLLVRGW